MALIKVNILKRFEAAFGLDARRLSISQEYAPADQEPVPDARLQQPQPVEAPPGYGPLGNPLFDQLTILPGITPANSEGGGQAYPEYKFNVDPLIDVQLPKRIVKTPIPGKDGTVKEMMSADDHQITIKGLLVNNSGEYPQAEKQELVNMLDLNASLEISSKFLNTFGISHLVVESYSFGSLEGFPDTLPFTIKCVSDRSDELYFDEIITE